MLSEKFKCTARDITLAGFAICSAGFGVVCAIQGEFHSAATGFFIGAAAVSGCSDHRYSYLS